VRFVSIVLGLAVGVYMGLVIAGVLSCVRNTGRAGEM